MLSTREQAMLLSNAWPVDQGEEEIAAIREVRHRLSERFGHDPYRVVAYLMELQKEHPEKLLPAPETEAAGKATL